VPALTLGHVKLGDGLLQPAGGTLRPDVIDNPVAGFPSSVVKVTVTGVLLLVKTASDGGLTMFLILLFVVAVYATLTEPVLDSPALFMYV
jgi:hypothetical protein